jgi:hypothetical protein
VFTEVPGDHITLEDVHKVYPGFGPPPLIQRGPRGGTLEDLLPDGTPAEAVGQRTEHDEALHEEIVRREVLETARAIRSNSGPTTVFHALLLADGQTLGQLAAKLHLDPRELELPLQVLVSEGWAIEDASSRLHRYSLLGLAG